MKFQYNDGGRKEAGRKGHTGDCVCRAIAIVTGLPYQQVYAKLAAGNATQRKSSRTPKRGRTASSGIYTKRKWFKDFMSSLGFVWVPTMQVGSGCKVHLNEKELPGGRLIVVVSKHYTAVIDGVIHDTHNPSERGSTIYGNNFPVDELPKGAVKLENGNGYSYSPERCVYGYWHIPVSELQDDQLKREFITEMKYRLFNRMNLWELSILQSIFQNSEINFKELKSQQFDNPELMKQMIGEEATSILSKIKS